MKKIFLTVDDHLTQISTFEKGGWIHLQNPTREEIEGLNARFALDPTYLQAALDEQGLGTADFWVASATAIRP